MQSLLRRARLRAAARNRAAAVGLTQRRRPLRGDRTATVMM